MLSPKRTKFRKMFKGRIKGLAKGGSDLNFGSFGLKATQPERVTARQIEAARRAMTRHMKRQGRVWIRIFPDVPVTNKPTEVRMGKGKGSVEYWACKDLEGARGVEQIKRSLNKLKIQHPGKFGDDELISPKSTNTKLTALARSIDLEGRWTHFH